MGIRVALGARAGNVTRMVLRQGMAPLVGGLVMGVLAALWAGWQPISANVSIRISNGVRGARTFACHVGTRADAWLGDMEQCARDFARSRTLFLYGFSSPPPSHLPAGPMAIPYLASVWQLASGPIPASASPVGRAGFRLDGSLP